MTGIWHNENSLRVKYAPPGVYMEFNQSGYVRDEAARPCRILLTDIYTIMSLSSHPNDAHNPNRTYTSFLLVQNNNFDMLNNVPKSQATFNDTREEMEKLGCVFFPPVCVHELEA